MAEAVAGIAADQRENSAQKVIGRPFQRGRSGNPHGRPKTVFRVSDEAAKHAVTAVRKLVALMDSEDERVAKAACDSILDRAVGKPSQAITGADGQALSLSILIDLGRAAAQVQERQLAGEQTLQIPEVTK